MDGWEADFSLVFSSLVVAFLVFFFYFSSLLPLPLPLPPSLVWPASLLNFFPFLLFLSFFILFYFLFYFFYFSIF